MWNSKLINYKKMKQCKRKTCREMNPDDAEFCQYCGYKFGRMRKMISWLLGGLLCITVLTTGYLVYLRPSQPVSEPEPLPKPFTIPVPNNKTERKGVIRFLPNPGNPKTFNLYIVETDSEKNWTLIASKISFSNFDSLDICLRDFHNYHVPTSRISLLCDTKDEQFVRDLLSDQFRTAYNPNIRINKPENDDFYLFSAVIPECYQNNGCLVDIDRDKISFRWKTGHETVQLGYAKSIDESTIRVELSRIMDLIPKDYTDFFFVTGDFFSKLSEASTDDNSNATDFVFLQEPENYQHLTSDNVVSNGLKLYQGIMDVSRKKNFIFRKSACRDIGYLLCN